MSILFVVGGGSRGIFGRIPVSDSKRFRQKGFANRSIRNGKRPRRYTKELIEEKKSASEIIFLAGIGVSRDMIAEEMISCEMNKASAG